MPTIDISGSTLMRLQMRADPLVDTPDTVIQRILDMTDSGPPPKHQAVWWGPGTLKHRIRAPKGAKTPTAEIRSVLYKVLKEAGGELGTSEAIDRVGEVMKDKWNEVDLAPLKSGEVRWRNTVRWTYVELTKEGIIDENSGHGRWRLTGKPLEMEDEQDERGTRDEENEAGAAHSREDQEKQD